MKYFFALCCMFAFIANAHALTCPPESYLVEFTSPVSGEKKRWCQKTIDGAYVKHGPEEIDLPDGTRKLNHYENDKLQAPQVARPSPVETETKVETATSPESQAPVIATSSGQDIPKSLVNKRPASFTFMPGSVGIELKKKPDVFWHDMREYLLGKLQLLQTQGPSQDNELSLAFFMIPGMDGPTSKKLALYYQKLLPEKNNSKILRNFLDHPLGLLFHDLVEVAKNGDTETLRVYLEEFKFPPDFKLKSYAPMTHIMARYSKLPRIMLGMIEAKGVPLNVIAYCGHEKPYCPKIGDVVELTCTPMDAAALEGNLESVSYLLGQGLSPNGNASNTASPLAFALYKNQKDMFNLLLNAEGIDHNFKISEVACHFTTGNIFGNAIAMEDKLSFVDILLQKGMTFGQSLPDALSAACVQELYRVDWKAFDILQKKTLEKFKWLVEKGFAMKDALANNDTIIRSAIRLQFVDIVHFLMSFEGIDINKANELGRSPVFNAFNSIEWGDEKQPKDWIKKRKEEPPSKTISRLKMMQYIFDHGGKRQIRDVKGQGLIHYATLELPFSQLLLDYIKSKDSW